MEGLCNDIKTLHVLAGSCLPQQIFNFPSNLLTRLMKKASNSPQVSKPAGNTRKIANKLNDRSFWRSKHDLTYHVASSIIFEICPMAIIVRVCLFVEGRGSRVFFRVWRVHCRVSRVHCLGSLFYMKECMEVSKENSIKLRIACSLFLSLLISVYSVVTRDYDYPCVARLTFCFT